MRAARLDTTDWLILRELQADGRITNIELARKVGISAPPCLRRVRALEEAGIIEGFTAILDDKALGFDVSAFAMIKLHSQAEADLIAFEERVAATPDRARLLHAVGRDRFSAALRGAGLERLPGLHHSRADGRAQCGKRQDDARDPRLETCGRRADGARRRRADGRARRPSAPR